MTKEKKTFDENSKLGFMRFIQVWNILTLLLTGLVLVLMDGSDIKVTVPVIANVLILLSQAAVIWLIAHRKLYTRQLVIGFEVFEYLVALATLWNDGELTIARALFGAIPGAIVILYFAFSPRAKAVLVQPWDDDTLAEEQEERHHQLWDPTSKEFWMRLVLYFFLFSIMGHWMEMGVQILVVNGLFPGTVASPDSLTWRDSLNPFFIYGIAVAVCGLVLYPTYLLLKKKMPRKWQALIISFLINMVFCALAELILGMLFNADYHAWDYRNQFMNFQGQVCLLYTVAFGVISSLITWFVYPMMELALSRMRHDIFRAFFVVATVLFLLICAAYNIDPQGILGEQDASSSEQVATSSSSADPNGASDVGT